MRCGGAGAAAAWGSWPQSRSRERETAAQFPFSFIQPWVSAHGWFHSHLGFIFPPQLIRSEKSLEGSITQGFVSVVTVKLTTKISHHGDANTCFVHVLLGRLSFIHFWTSSSQSSCFQEVLSIYTYSSVARVWCLLSSSLWILHVARMSAFFMVLAIINTCGSVYYELRSGSMADSFFKAGVHRTTLLYYDTLFFKRSRQCRGMFLTNSFYIWEKKNPSRCGILLTMIQ